LRGGAADGRVLSLRYTSEFDFEFDPGLESDVRRREARPKE